MTAEELLLRIRGDSSEGQQAVSQLADALATGLSKALRDLNDDTDKSNQKTSALKKYLDDLVPSTKDAHGAFSDLKSTLSEMWEHPIEGVSHFAKALSTDLSPMLGPIAIGVAGVAGALTVMASAAYEVTEKTAAVGANIQDMAYKTGIAVPALSTWRGALEIAGSSLDQFSNAIFMMQRRMAEGGPQFEAGLQRINLQMKDLDGLQPDQQFLKMAEGIRTIEDPAQRAAAAMEIFGRPGRELLPLIMKNLEDLVGQSKALGSTWSGEDAKAAEEFEMKSRALRLELANVGLAIGKELVGPLTKALDFAKGSVGWFIMEGYIGLQAGKLVASAMGVPVFGGSGPTYPSVSGPAGFGAADAGVDADARQREVAAQRLAEQLHWVDIVAESHKKVEKIEEEYATDSMNWTDKVGNHKLEAIAGWKEGGSKVFDEMFKNEREYATGAMDWTNKLSTTRDNSDIEFAKHASRTMDETQFLWNEYYDVVGRRSRTAEQQQMADVDRWYQDKVVKAQQAGITDRGYYDALAAVAKVRMDDVRLSHNLTFQAVQKMQSDLTVGWQTSFAKTLTDGNFSVAGFASAFEGIFQTLKHDVEDIFGAMLTSIIQGFLQPLLDNVRNVAASVSSMLIGALTGQGGGDGGFGGFVSGGGGGGLVQTALGGTLSSLFSGGGAAVVSGMTIPGAEFSASTIYGVGTSAGAGGGIGGAISGALSSTGSALGTAAAFLATNPIGWAIDAGIGALALWNHFSGPNDTELAGRSAVKQWESGVWTGLSSKQRNEAIGAGWSNPQDAGALIWMRDSYAGMGAAHPDQSAQSYMQNVWGSQVKGYSGVVSAIQDVHTYMMAAGGAMRVTKPTLFVAGEAGDEDVAFSGANKRFSGTGDVTIHVDARGSFFPSRQALRDLARQIGDTYMDRIRQVRPVSFSQA